MGDYMQIEYMFNEALNKYIVYITADDGSTDTLYTSYLKVVKLKDIKKEMEE
jgi:hypothetical protein